MSILEASIMYKLLSAALALGVAAYSAGATAEARIVGAGLTKPPSAARLLNLNRTPLNNRNAPHSRRLRTLSVTDWTSTATQGISLANAAFSGPATQNIHVSVALQLHNVSQLNQLVAAGQEVDPATFQAQYSPSSADVALVTNYLSSQGFSNISVEPNNLLVQADAPAAVVNSAFNTSIGNFVQNGQAVYANTTPAMVPSSLGNVVVAVLGLNNALKMSTPHRQNCIKGGTLPSGAPCVKFYDPQSFNLAYDAASTPAATRTSVAIMTAGDSSQAQSWWRTNEKQFGMATVPLTIELVGIPTPPLANGDGEWNLDLTYSQAMAGLNMQHMYIYQTPSLTDQDIALEYNKWVTQHLAKVGNSSFGGCEFGPYLDGSMVVMDMILLQGAAQGQTMFASTGDSGGFCGVGVPNGVPAGAPFTEYPASSPYAVAVGGTDLFTNNDGSYAGETSWEAGGGGNSQFEYSPYWEASAQPIAGTGQVSMRGLPDIAYDASIETGAGIYEGSAEYITGGTSLSSPMQAGVWARLQSSHGNRLAFAPPRYYNVYKASTASAATVGPPATRYYGPYHDILVGSNVTYTALPGYDYTTGLGSIDIAKMNAAIGTVSAMSRFRHL
ncbi:MAG: S53 family peptidase [Candidatus Eremiobacteraeota bacterium]|nr:S53 family peptidase [Candidatus Eremiobacteraeota bacterium]